MTLKEYCENLHNTTKSFAFHFKIKKDNMIEQMIEATSFLSENEKLSTRVYCILNDINEIPKCYCGNPVSFKQYSKGFQTFCSSKCAANSKEKKDKIIKTNLKKYGCTNVFQSEAGREGYKNFHADEKRVQKAIEKSAETLRKNFGVETVEEAHKLRVEKTQESKLKKYRNKYYNNRAKAQLSRDEKKIRENLKKSCLEKYGVDSFSKTEEGRKILSERMKERHKNGFTEEQREISLRKYGVEHISQVPEFFEKMNKVTYKHKDYVFPSGKKIKVQGYEDYALDYLLIIYDESEIITETTKIPQITYFDANNKQHKYYPDFFIPKDNLIIEVKSIYTMRAKFYTNLLKAQASKSEGFNFRFLIFDKEDLLN